MLFEVFFGEVLKVSLGEVDVGLNSYLLVVTADSHGFSEVAGSSADFDACSEELSEIVGIEDLILNGLWAINGEWVRNFGLSVLFLCNLGLGLLGQSGLCLFCGHIKNNWLIILKLLSIYSINQALARHK